MSKEIDWSMAPEGATHCTLKPKDNNMYRSVFWRVVDGKAVEAWPVGDDWSAQGHFEYGPEGCNTYLQHASVERPSSAWTGTGLPPVGTVCEFYSEEDEEWLEGKIIAHGVDEGRKLAIMQCDDSVWMGEDHEFRVKRTSEQIAAEERDKKVEAMVDDIARNTTGIDRKEAWCCATALYDAGYRKTEVGK